MHVHDVDVLHELIRGRLQHFVSHDAGVALQDAYAYERARIRWLEAGAADDFPVVESDFRERQRLQQRRGYLAGGGGRGWQQKKDVQQHPPTSGSGGILSLS